MKTLTGIFLFCLLFNSPIANSQTQKFAYNVATSAADDPADIKIFYRKDSINQKVNLTVINPLGKKIMVIFYSRGMKYYYPTSLKNYRISFNFSDAEDGLYSFVVRDGKREFRRELQIQTRYETKRTIKMIEASNG